MFNVQLSVIDLIYFYISSDFVLTLTSFSESPLHLLTILEAEMLKNVVLHSVATAFASNVFPVPAIHEVHNMRCSSLYSVRNVVNFTLAYILHF